MVGWSRAAHKRHGLASEITSYKNASGGAPQYACIGTAISSGSMYATIIVTRHISSANCAFAFARLGLPSPPWWVMRVIGATNGRIPFMTCEYRLTKEDMHCQYCRVCGFLISMLKSTKNTFSIALSLGRIVALGKLISIPSISTIWAWTFFLTDSPSGRMTLSIVSWTIAWVEIVSMNVPVPKKSST